MSLRGAIRNVIGESRYAKLQFSRRAYENWKFMRQKEGVLNVGKFHLKAPSGHILFRLQPQQPYRDLMIGLLASQLASKYPGEALVDIGANIGDTAAIMASNSPSPIVLVEPSDYYGRFLRENAALFPNPITIHNCMVSANSSERGILKHGGGTATFEVLASGPVLNSKSLAEVAGDHPRLIKIDTDGFDLPIIAAAIEFLAVHKPCLVFENDPREAETMALASRVLTDLNSIGYSHFVVFDDTGRHVLSTSELAAVLDLNRYWYKRAVGPDGGEVFEQNVICIPAEDKPIFDAVTAYYRSY